MNDPNKRIDIDKSSLLSLKAELLRKQEEITRAKSYTSIHDFVPKRAVKPEKDKKENKKVPEKKTSVIEDTALLMKSKKMLQRKAKYYEKMTTGGGSLNSDENCLVMFNQKKQESRVQSTYIESSSDDSEHDNYEAYKANDPDEEWVEYTDCLGRTRQCQKKDLVNFQKRDKDLSRIAESKEHDNTVEEKNANMTNMESGELPGSDTEVNDVDNSSSMAEPIGTRFKQMLDKWDDQEVKNMDKEYVHYQDILFDEARTHGVGFYEFSTDEEERAKQQKELEAIRKTTLEAQKNREELRKNRDKIIADRVKAAKARQRARLGLPPEEDEPTVEEDLYDKTEELKRKEKEDEEKRLKQIDDEKREIERQQHVRPWDKGKSSSKRNFDAKSDEDDEDEEKEWKPRIPREPLTQAQWNEKQRDLRNKEFAPVPENSFTRKSNSCKTEDMSRVAPPSSYNFSKYDVSRNNISLPNEYLPDVDDLPEEPNKSLYFTTKKSVPKRPLYPPSTSAGFSYNVNDDEDGDLRPPGTEIPPPPTFDYYGPTSSKQHRKTKSSPIDLEKSIEAGLQFLRKQSDKSNTKN